MKELTGDSLMEHLTIYAHLYSRPLDFEMGDCIFRMSFSVFKDLFDNILKKRIKSMTLMDCCNDLLSYSIPVIIRKVIISRQIVLHGVVELPEGRRKQCILLKAKYDNYKRLSSKVKTRIYSLYEVEASNDIR